MGKDVGITATRFFQGIGQDEQAVESPLFVYGLSQFDHRAVVPRETSRFEKDGSEGVAEEFSQEMILLQSTRKGALLLQ